MYVNESDKTTLLWTKLKKGQNSRRYTLNYRSWMLNYYNVEI
jgi:hypothetical protein